MLSTTSDRHLEREREREIITGIMKKGVIHFIYKITNNANTAYIEGMDILFWMALAMRAATQYWENHVQVVESEQHSIASTSRSQANATRD